MDGTKISAIDLKVIKTSSFKSYSTNWTNDILALNLSELEGCNDMFLSKYNLANQTNFLIDRSGRKILAIRLRASKCPYKPYSIKCVKDSFALNLSKLTASITRSQGILSSE
jgi:hypothetical protein